MIAGCGPIGLLALQLVRQASAALLTADHTLAQVVTERNDIDVLYRVVEDLTATLGGISGSAAVSVARCAATALATFEIWRLHGFHPFTRSSLKLADCCRRNGIGS